MTLADVERIRAYLDTFNAMPAVERPGSVPVSMRDMRRLVALVEHQQETIVALRAALLEQAQLAEEAGLALRGVYRTARGVANDPSLNGGPR